MDRVKCKNGDPVSIILKHKVTLIEMPLRAKKFQVHVPIFLDTCLGRFQKIALMSHIDFQLVPGLPRGHPSGHVCKEAFILD